MNKKERSSFQFYEKSILVEPSLEATFIEFFDFDKDAETIVRLFEKTKRFQFLKDPKDAHKWKDKAAILGVSFDIFLNRLDEYYLELALNSAKNPELILIDVIKNKWLRETDILFFKNKYRIFKFRKVDLVKTSSGNSVIFRNESYTELTVTLPKFLMREMERFFNESSKISMQKFFEKIFTDFVKANGLWFSSKGDAQFGAEDLEDLVKKVGETNNWHPFDFKSPPGQHSSEELGNQFMCFSYLSKNRHSRFFMGDTATIKKRINLKETHFDPFKELIYYVSSRLWRTPGELISILIMCRWRMVDRASLSFGALTYEPDSLGINKNMIFGRFVEEIMSNP